VTEHQVSSKQEHMSELFEQQKSVWQQLQILKLLRQDAQI
jgi:hypothetical protein